jgi:DNA polymerase sigma
VDVVISMSPQAIMNRVQGRRPKGREHVEGNIQKLRKIVMRACTDMLVGSGSFKFRRSAFRGDEPKVTMVMPPTPGICDKGVPMTISINAQTPMYNAALITESGQIEPRAQALIVLVKRWAKDRGICHAAKAHLSPYAWTLLTIYFLQVGTDDGEGPLLPRLDEFKTCSGLLDVRAGKVATNDASLHSTAPAIKPRPGLGGREISASVADAPWRRKDVPCQVQAFGFARKDSKSKSSLGKLFKDFVRFYFERFDWRKEAVSVRMGRRAAPDNALPLHIILSEEGSGTEVGPSIEDPFRAATNLGACLNAYSLLRLRGEFLRAHELCTQGSSLTMLLKPWCPAGQDAEADSTQEAATRAEEPDGDEL